MHGSHVDLHYFPACTGFCHITRLDLHCAATAQYHTLLSSHTKIQHATAQALASTHGLEHVHAQAIAQLPDYTLSKGVKLEHELSQYCGINVGINIGIDTVASILESLFFCRDAQALDDLPHTQCLPLLRFPLFASLSQDTQWTLYLHHDLYKHSPQQKGCARCDSSDLVT